MNLNLAIDPSIDQAAFFGHADRNLKVLRELLDVHLSARNETLRISGEPAAVSRAAAVIAELQRYLRHHSHVDRDQLVAIVRAPNLKSPTMPASPDPMTVVPSTSPPAASLFTPKPKAKSGISIPSLKMIWSSAKAPPAPARPFSPWPWPCRFFADLLSVASCWFGPPWKPAKNSASSPGALRKR